MMMLMICYFLFLLETFHWTRKLWGFEGVADKYNQAIEETPDSVRWDHSLPPRDHNDRQTYARGQSIRVELRLETLG